MNQLTINKPRKNHNLHCAGVMAVAERELAAFFSAVTELFGPELAEVSAEEWLEELVATDGLPSSAREWRRITLNVCKRLARLSAFSSELPTLTARRSRKHSAVSTQYSATSPFGGRKAAWQNPSRPATNLIVSSA